MFNRYLSGYLRHLAAMACLSCLIQQFNRFCERIGGGIANGNV